MHHNKREMFIVLRNVLRLIIQLLKYFRAAMSDVKYPSKAANSVRVSCCLMTRQISLIGSYDCLCSTSLVDDEADCDVLEASETFSSVWTYDKQSTYWL
jgi:hypothetical protein